MRTFYTVYYRNPVLAHVLFSTSAVREPLEIFYVCRDQKKHFFSLFPFLHHSRGAWFVSRPMCCLAPSVIYSLLADLGVTMSRFWHCDQDNHLTGRGWEATSDLYQASKQGCITAKHLVFRKCHTQRKRKIRIGCPRREMNPGRSIFPVLVCKTDDHLWWTSVNLSPSHSKLPTTKGFKMEAVCQSTPVQHHAAHQQNSFMVSLIIQRQLPCSWLNTHTAFSKTWAFTNFESFFFLLSYK